MEAVSASANAQGVVGKPGDTIVVKEDGTAVVSSRPEDQPATEDCDDE